MTRDEIIRVQRGLCALAYPVTIDGLLGPETHRAIMDFQRARGLAINGDPNAETLAALWRAVPPEMPPAPSSDALQLAGERAVAEAQRLWSLDVYDPRLNDQTPNAIRCKDIIGGIIKRAGWSWSLRNGAYLGDGPPQWCGLFAADCWRAAGIDPQWLATFWASTLRMAKWFRYEDWNGKSAGERGGRMIMRGTEITFPDGTAPRAGDIVIVGDGTPAEGDHITLLVQYAPSVYTTISGNGGGVGPTGKHREGISRADYFPTRGGYRVLWVARPGVEDLIA